MARTAKEKMEALQNQTMDYYFDPDNCNEVELFKAQKLSGELLAEMRTVSSIGRDEIKILINNYYQVQDMRKATREQIRSIEAGRAVGSKSNVAILDWMLKNNVIIEKGVEDALDAITMSTPVGRWLRGIVGIGPILSGGLLAYLDVTNIQYATAFHSYAGLNDNNRPWLGTAKTTEIVNSIIPSRGKVTDEMVVEIAAKTQWSYEYIRENAYVPKKKDSDEMKWDKSKIILCCSKIPYNRSLKVLMYKVGASFQWLCNNEKSLYGRLYSERRVLETKRNENGEYAKQAANILATKNIGKTTAAYKAYSQGMLPAAHIAARASRWTQKIFLSHLFEEMYRVQYDKVPPRYYSLEYSNGQHNREILPEVPYTKVSSEM